MDTNHILIAIDDSKSSERAVKEVAHQLHDPSGYHLTLLHVLSPVPPRLLEHGGSENPEEEERIEAKQDAAQDAWQQQATQASQPIFANALAILKQANIPEQAVDTQTYAPVPGQDVSTAIADVARDHGCGTVVVGQSAYSWLHDVLHAHVADKLRREDRAFKVWVVEDET
jgi:nucleotide-binding universal stress UspA family protein